MALTVRTPGFGVAGRSSGASALQSLEDAAGPHPGLDRRHAVDPAADTTSLLRAAIPGSQPGGLH